jgi:hypothetical protein
MRRQSLPITCEEERSRLRALLRLALGPVRSSVTSEAARNCPSVGLSDPRRARRALTSREELVPVAIWCSSGGRAHRTSHPPARIPAGPARDVPDGIENVKPAVR